MRLTERGITTLTAGLHASLYSLAIGSTGRMATVVDATLYALRGLTRLTHLDLSGCVAVTDAGRCFFLGGVGMSVGVVVCGVKAFQRVCVGVCGMKAL